MFRRVARRRPPPPRGPSPRELQAAASAVAPFAEEFRRLRLEVNLLRALAEPFHVRPGTLDPNIFGDVFLGNEYELPARFAAGDVVIDVGAHVGSFSAACLVRGAGRVVAFEPVPANHALCRVNLARFGGRGEARLAAVWRSDVPPTRLHYTASADPANTGGGNVLSGGGGDAPIDAVPLDAVVAELLAASGQARVRLLKLDCEGSEYPILLSATCLGRVAEVCGEYHEVGVATPAARVGAYASHGPAVLVEHLSAAGFAVTTRVHPRDPNIGLFWARR